MGREEQRWVTRAGGALRKQTAVNTSSKYLGNPQGVCRRAPAAFRAAASAAPRPSSGRRLRWGAPCEPVRAGVWQGFGRRGEDGVCRCAFVIRPGEAGQAPAQRGARTSGRAAAAWEPAPRRARARARVFAPRVAAPAGGNELFHRLRHVAVPAWGRRRRRARAQRQAVGAGPEAGARHASAGPRRRRACAAHSHFYTQCRAALCSLWPGRPPVSLHTYVQRYAHAAH